MPNSMQVQTKVGRWFYGWNIVTVGFTSQLFVVGLSTGCFSVFVLPLEREMNASRFTVTLVYSCLFIGMILFAPFVQWLIKKTSIRVCMTVGAASLSLGLFTLSFTNSIYQIIAIYALLIAIGTTFAGAIPCSTLVVNWFTRLRGRAMGLSTIGSSAGGFITPPLAAYMIISLGWRDTYMLLAVLSAVILIPAIFLFISDTPADRGLNPDGDTQVTIATQNTTPPLSTSEILTTPAYWVIAIFIGIGTTVYKGILVNLIPLVVERGYSELEGAYLVSTLTIFMIVGKLLIGASSDKIKSSIILSIALLLAALGVVVFALSSEILGLIIGSILLGTGTGGYFPLIGIIIGENFPRIMFAKVMGLMMPAIYIFTVPGAPLAGYLYDTSGSYISTLWVFAIIMIAASFLSFMTGKKL